MQITAEERARKRKEEDRIREQKTIDYIRSKPCLICKHADTKNITRVNLCGPSQHVPFLEIPCAKCMIGGLYGEKHEREEIVLHDPMTGSYWIDGGGNSNECTNFEIEMGE